MNALEQASIVKTKYESKLRSLMNVTGVAVGYKSVGGKLTSQVAIIVYVRRKLPIELLPKDQVVPSEIEGVPTDVVEAEFTALSTSRTSKIRPAVGGISVGHYQVTAGTITNIFYDFETLELKLTSNNHVIARSEPLQEAHKGDPIYQPGPYDGGTANDTIAYLERWVPIHNNVTIDGAVGNPVNQNDVSINHYDFDTVVSPAIRPKLGDHVLKGGRTTGLTEGVVSAVKATVDVNYRVAVVTLRDQIIVNAVNPPFVQGGDSGSLAVLKGTRNPYGVVFAGSGYGDVGVLNSFINFSNLLKVGVPSILELYVQTPQGNVPTPPAVVEVSPLDFVAFTDELGRVFIGNLLEGEVYVKIVHPDFSPFEGTIDVTYPKTKYTVKLEEKPPPTRTLAQQTIDAFATLLPYITAYPIIEAILKPQLISNFKALKEEIM